MMALNKNFVEQSTVIYNMNKCSELEESVRNIHEEMVGMNWTAHDQTIYRVANSIKLLPNYLSSKDPDLFVRGVFLAGIYSDCIKILYELQSFVEDDKPPFKNDIESWEKKIFIVLDFVTEEITKNGELIRLARGIQSLLNEKSENKK